MANSEKNNILIIGSPNVGKTHFGGQLYGRLNSKRFAYKISTDNRPTDLSIFQDVLDNLNNGLRASHTEASANKDIQLKIVGESGETITLSFPDYGGEQVKLIVENRRVNTIWQEYIDNSTSWILFVRLDEIEQVEDIINRGIPSPEEVKKRNAQIPPVKLTDSAYFVELLQMLLHIKAVSSANKIDKPNLTILLSCWDILKEQFNLQESKIPADVLKEQMPLLYNFIKNNWHEDSLSILGLSSTGKTLNDTPDEDYIDFTPIEFGYFIDGMGNKKQDLTLSISTFIGRT